VRARIGAPELRRPVQVVDRDGSIEATTLSPDGHVALYCEVVLGGQEGLIELVLGYRDGNGELRMRSRRERANYLPAEGCGALVRAAARARGRGEELFVTPLPRAFAEPGKGAARAGSVVWVDVDGQSRGSELGRMAALRPHLTVHSGGGVHCYWRLCREHEPEEIESLNRRLCHLIGGDPACTDRGRIMRLPGSFNAKRGRWCRVLRADRSRALVDPDQVRRKLADPDPPRPAPAPRPNGHGGGDGLDLIDPPSYFSALCEVDVPGEGGMVKCPLPDHEDSYASCQVFPEAERGWWCYGCSRGGRVYDLTSLLAGGPWGRELRGERFSEVRALVLAALR
jgi:RepB DNA-primase from phage plasmid